MSASQNMAFQEPIDVPAIIRTRSSASFSSRKPWIAFIAPAWYAPLAPPPARMIPMRSKSSRRPPPPGSGPGDSTTSTRGRFRIQR